MVLNFHQQFIDPLRSAPMFKIVYLPALPMGALYLIHPYPPGVALWGLSFMGEATQPWAQHSDRDGGHQRRKEQQLSKHFHLHSPLDARRSLMKRNTLKYPFYREGTDAQRKRQTEQSWRSG